MILDPQSLGYPLQVVGLSMLVVSIGLYLITWLTERGKDSHK